MISLQQVSKQYSYKHNINFAVQDVTLHIEQGEIHGLIGESGAGKSTLLRMMNLLEPPDEGQIQIDGKIMTSLSKSALRRARSSIGMIFQHFNLVSNYTVERNVEIPLRLAGVPKNIRKERVKECLKYVGLHDKINQYPSELSGGQKQRVAIARALANRPPVLLCDEPTSALDRQSTENILDLLASVNKELGVTIVIVSHDLHVVKSICHRVSILDKGCLLDTISISPRRSRIPKGDPTWYLQQLRN